jgi:small subunit ribosomal protein S21
VPFAVKIKKLCFFEVFISFFQIFLYLCTPKSPKGGINTMLIIDSKDCENIDKALKKYKKKFEKSKTLLQLRDRQAFTKPSIRRRMEVKKAVYIQQMNDGKFD